VPSGPPSSRVLRLVPTSVLRVLALAMLVPATAAGAQDAASGWPMTGGDAAHRGTVEGPVPPYRVAWEAPFPGGLAAGPVVAGGVVIGMGRDRIAALDARTGEELWKAQRSPGRAGSPAVTGDLVIHASGTESQTAVIARALEDGSERWRAFTGSAVRAGLVTRGGTVYAGTAEGLVMALGARDGEEVWRLDLEGAIEAAPALSDGSLVVALEQRRGGTSAVVSIDAETGKEGWRFTSLPSGAGATPPSIAQGVVYVGAADGSVHALDLETGSERWSTGAESEHVLPPPIFTAHQVPAVAGDPIVADIAHLARFDAGTGREIWTFRFLDGLYRSGVAVVGGYGLVGDFSGGLAAVDLKSGLLVWKSDLGRGPAVSPAADGVRVYAGLVGVKRPAEPSPAGSPSALEEPAGPDMENTATGRIGSVIALEHDPSGSLRNVPSESTLFPLRAALNFLAAALAVALVSVGLFRFALRRASGRGAEEGK
jgi:outer membrane protein assembly factor BamB